MHSVAVAQLGARMHYAVPRILARGGRLERLFTDACATKGAMPLLGKLPARWQPAAVRKLMARVPRDIPDERITAFTAFGLEYALRRRWARNAADMTRVHLWAGRRFGRLVCRHGLGEAGVLYALNTAALHLFEGAAESRVLKVLEQTIAPHALERELVEAEARRFPAWRDAPAPRAADESAADHVCERERGEWARADRVICGSDFVREALIRLGVAGEKCRVVPYGVELPAHVAPRRAPQRRLRVLSVGTLGLRKGTPYVVEAAKRLHDVADFRLVGPFSAPGVPALIDLPNVTVTGPVVRPEVEAQYLWADLFLLPSVCEGSATATYEALAMGLPLVCTANTGSVVRDGVDGFIVPAGDAGAVVERILQLHEDRERLAWMQQMARERSAQYGLRQYGERLLAALDPTSP